MHRKIGFAAVFVLAAAAHVLMTLVVILFVVSTLNILNRNIFHFDSINYLEIGITAILLILSVQVFLRAFKKISLFIKTNLFPDLLP